MVKTLWCDSKECAFWRSMDLVETTVKGIPEIEAYVCPTCHLPKWMPGESINPFLRGLYGVEHLPVEAERKEVS